MEDYFKEMEMAMNKAHVEEDQEAKMVQFLRGLNSNIANIICLHFYIDLEILKNIAIKVDRQNM